MAQLGRGGETESSELARQIETLTTEAIDKQEGTASHRAEMYAQRGNARITLGLVTDAVADLSEAVTLAADRAEYWALRAYANGLLGRQLDAVGDLDRVLAIEPDNGGVYANRAVLREELGDIAGAESDYTQAIARDPAASDLLEYRGDLYAQQGALDSAIVDYQNAIRAAQAKRDQLPDVVRQGYDPTEVELRMKLAAIHEQQGDREDALREFDAVLTIDGENIDATEGRKRVSSREDGGND